MKISGKLNELKPTDLNCNVFDVYSYDGLSMQDLLCQFFTKINECIKVSNETIDLASYLVNEGLKIEVVEKLMLWLNDGTLENLINVNLFNTLHTKIENLKHIKVNVLDFGAKGDGVTNDTQSIRSAIEYCKTSGINNLIIPPGVYMVDCSIKWEQHSPIWNGDKYHAFMLHDNLNIFMHGATLKCIPNSNTNYIMFRVENCSNVRIEGGSLIGDRDRHIGDEGEWGYGISIRNTQNITISDLTSKNFWGDGLYFSNILTDGEVIKNIEIRNCVFDNNRRQGISISGGEDIKILNCSLKNTNGTAPQSGIDIEPDEGYLPVKNLLIDGCYFANNAGNGIESWIGGSTVDNDINACENVVLSNSTFVDDNINFRSGRDFKVLNCINPMINSQNVTNFEIINNTSNRNMFVYLHSVNNVKIKNNTHVRNTQSWSVGVNLTGVCTDVEMSNNSFRYIDHPVQLEGGHTNVSILNNNFTNYSTGVNAMSDGISNVFINNNLFKNSRENDLVIGYNNVIVSNNTFDSFAKKCFGFARKSRKITITHNLFNDTLSPIDTAMFTFSGSDIEVLNNVVKSSDRKVFLNSDMEDEGVLVCRNIFDFQNMRNWFSNSNEDIFIDNYTPNSNI